MTADQFAVNAAWLSRQTGRVIRIVKAWEDGWFTICDSDSPGRRYRSISKSGLRRKYWPVES